MTFYGVKRLRGELALFIFHIHYMFVAINMYLVISENTSVTKIYYFIYIKNVIS